MPPESRTLHLKSRKGYFHSSSHSAIYQLLIEHLQGTGSPMVTKTTRGENTPAIQLVWEQDHFHTTPNSRLLDPSCPAFWAPCVAPQGTPWKWPQITQTHIISNQCSSSFVMSVMFEKYQLCEKESKGQSGQWDRVNASAKMHKSCLSSLKQGLWGKGVCATLREGWEGYIHQHTSSESLTTDQRFSDQ